MRLRGFAATVAALTVLSWGAPASAQHAPTEDLEAISVSMTQSLPDHDASPGVDQLAGGGLTAAGLGLALAARRRRLRAGNC